MASMTTKNDATIAQLVKVSKPPFFRATSKAVSLIAAAKAKHSKAHRLHVLRCNRRKQTQPPMKNGEYCDINTFLIRKEVAIVEARIQAHITSSIRCRRPHRIRIAINK